MGYIIYVDTIFMINVCMDYLLLSALGRLTRKKKYRYHQMAASILGGVGAILRVYKIPIPYVLLVYGMIQIAYPETKKLEALKSTIYFYGLTILTGGCFFFLREQNMLKNKAITLLLVSILIMELIEKGWNQILERGRFTKNLYPIDLIQGKIKVSGIALLDTGNHLYDPFFHRPVMIAEQEKMKELYSTYDKEKILWIPYHSLGKTNGMIPAMKVEELRIHKEDQLIKKREVLVAIKEENLSSQNQYHFILHEDLFTK
ncbi:MAG: sigma-E processing peptidase SpoIIGA [Acetivibrio sp.]